MDEKFYEKAGLFLGVACANLMSASIVITVLTEDTFYLITTTMSTIVMIGGFYVYCNSNNKLCDA